ncbi:MAG: acyl-CoA thioesterase [Myxococcales bacterium]|nr:MAG: acyl-CoA thioesterase [Myxococcales bacterium]
MTQHRYRIQILERHLDTFGHVNNATYLELFEEARWDWITRNGYGIERVQAERRGPTILEIKIAFKRELRNRAWIEIVSWMESYPSRVGTAVQQMLDDDGNVCCEARFVIGLFDLTERKLISPTPAWRVAVGLAESGVAEAATPEPND